MTTLSDIKQQIGKTPKKWLVTGCAGFIGSHLLEHLLDCGQKVVGIDNFCTGDPANLDDVRSKQSANWKNFEFVNDDIRKLLPNSSVFSDVDYVLHHAAMASVPLSIENPIETFDINVRGTELVLDASRRARVKKIVIASSSAVYGNNIEGVKHEDQVGTPLSPYANSKYLNERQALQLSQVYKLPTIALRYFNIYGSRQSTEGCYASVIPAWKQAIQNSRAPRIFGDGSQTRDFLHINDVVKANLIAATQEQMPNSMRVFNVGAGFSVTLLELFELMKVAAGGKTDLEPVHLADRPGDIKHSCSSIEKIKDQLGFQPELDLSAGLSQLFMSDLKPKVENYASGAKENLTYSYMK